MINRFDVTFEKLGFKTLSMSSNILRLHGNIEVCNSMLAAVEKCISEDLSPYIDSRDKEFGVHTDIVRSCSLVSDVAEVELNADSASSSYKDTYYRVIRGISSTVRITETPVDGGLDNATPERKKTWELARRGYPVYSEAICAADWLRLSKYVNSFDSNDVVSFNSSTHELVINKALMSVSAELLYMLLYEAYFKVPDNCRKIFLLPDMPFLKARDVGNIIRMLSCGNAVDSILYIRESSSLGDAHYMSDPALEF